ncbi:hypothetical protein G5V59_21115 [Nocardioides sp. W3-2-3]|uniref:hypothetical protein n=1 Tax=Nocardioides convexus TaxID=2712224 RepID=UPI00241844C5|nr:hypothetical protein [Nocardioides convexus]NHA01465.1 hypothetical protein [Nocardioides convexus]
MTESAQTPESTFVHGPIVWEDEVWILARHDAGGRLGLTLHHRDPEALGQAVRRPRLAGSAGSATA